jgi:hypothetical protein
VQVGSAGSSVAKLDQSIALMTQYSAAALDSSGPASNTVFQGVSQESLAPTLTQTHQVS